MKFKNTLVILLLIMLFIVSCQNSSSTSSLVSSDTSSFVSSQTSDEKISKVGLYSAPEGVSIAKDVTMQINGESVDLYEVMVNNSQRWNGLAPDRIPNYVAIIQLEGRATIEVKTEYELNYNTVIRPLYYNILPFTDIKNQTFTFEIFNVGSYVIEINGDRSNVIHLFVKSFEDDYTSLKNEENVIYFGPGLHNSSNNNLIKNNTVEIKSNQTVVIDYGAVVQARFVSHHTSNISLIGGGIIDGSVFSRIAGQPSGNTQFVPIDFNYCKNVLLKGITFLDPAGWCVNFYFIEDALIDGINIITSRSNGDGISLQSNQNVEVKNCFVRTWDDSLVVKNYPHWSDKSKHGLTRNIKFEDIIIWTDLAQSMEIGYETIGETLEDVIFDNITVLHNLHKPVISIHNGNNAKIKNIKFKNITVEDASMGLGDASSNNELIDIRVLYSSNFSSNHVVTPLGTISNVEIDNVKVISGNNNIPITIKGYYDNRYDSTHFVTNVSIKNVEIKGSIIKSNYPFLRTNEYINNLIISNDNNKINGAIIKRKWSKEELKEYSKVPIVIKNRNIVTV